MTYHSHSPEETKQIAQEILKNLLAGSVLALKGDLGAGKTTFVQGLAEGLGIKHPITSPTFIILREYTVNALATSGVANAAVIGEIDTLYHLDFYRLESRLELANLGLQEVFSDPTAISVVEWADKFPTILPQKTIWIEFEQIENSKRTIRVRP